MQSVRMTRRAKQREARRHTYKQRGGAEWAPVFTSEDDERFKDWVEEISGNATLKELFPSLLSMNRNDPVPVSEDEKKIQLKTYLNCLAHQDKLFRSALNIIKKKLISKIPALVGKELTSETIVKHASEIDSIKGDVIPYLQDAEKFVRFKNNVKGNPNNKFAELYKQATLLSTILLFPVRVENILIRALSEIIVSIMENPGIIDSANEGPSIKKVLATQYDSFAQSLSYTLASYPIWDGYHIGQGISTIQEIFHFDRTVTDSLVKKFWYKFVEAIITNKDKKIDERFIAPTGSECTKDNSKRSYEEDTADMLWYTVEMKGNINILNILTDNMRECPGLDIEKIRSSIPGSIYDTITIPDTTVTLKTLLSNINIEVLEFLLHLEVAIKECLERREKEKEAAAAASP